MQFNPLLYILIKLMNAPANTTLNKTDAKMRAGLHSNDQAVYLKIYDNYAASLLGMIMKWMKDKEKAEILLCRAFTGAWDNRNLFDAETDTVYCWLCRHARNCYN